MVSFVDNAVAFQFQFVFQLLFPVNSLFEQCLFQRASLLYQKTFCVQSMRKTLALRKKINFKISKECTNSNLLLRSRVAGYLNAIFCNYLNLKGEIMKKLLLICLILFSITLPSCSLHKVSENMLDLELIKQFNHYYFEYYAKDSLRGYDSRFLGVVIGQKPADMWILQELITEIRPDFIIETGTLFGGAALYYATILKQVNNKGKVKG